MIVFPPSSRKTFDTLGFAKHLTAIGAEMKDPTNVWEVVRYKADGATHIVYMKANGALTYTGDSKAHYTNFLSNREQLKAVKTKKAAKPKPSRKHIRDALRQRDGDTCWYCGCFVEGEGTVEHLIPRSAGGLNAMSNLVLAHQLCNQRAGSLHLSEKITLRARMHAVQAEALPWVA